MRKTLARTGAALLFVAMGLPNQAHAYASCSGDPCADVECTSDYASAAAYGSEYSHAVATAGGAHAEKTQAGGGSSGAYADGGAPTEADAKAKKDWSFKESTAKCSVKAAAEVSDFVTEFIAAVLHEEHGAALANVVRPGGLAIGCVADYRIHTNEHFAGRLYVGRDGSLVLFDAARRDGLTLTGLALTFDGASLDAAAPVSIAGLVATDLVVTLDLVDNARTAGCAVTLSD